MKGLRRQEQFQGFWCKSTLLMLAKGRKESLTEIYIEYILKYILNILMLAKGQKESLTRILESFCWFALFSCDFSTTKNLLDICCVLLQRKYGVGWDDWQLNVDDGNLFCCKWDPSSHCVITSPRLTRELDVGTKEVQLAVNDKNWIKEQRNPVYFWAGADIYLNSQIILQSLL